MAADQIHTQTGHIDGGSTGVTPPGSLTSPPSLIDGVPAGDKGDARYICRVGQISLVFTASINIEVLLDSAIYRMPNTPAWLLGLCNRRGDLVPVFDLRALLEISPPATDKNYLFIVDKGEYACGFFIDDYPASAYSLKQLSKLPVMPELLKNHVITAYEHEQQNLLEIDHRSLFTAITEQLSSLG